MMIMKIVNIRFCMLDTVFPNCQKVCVVSYNVSTWPKMVAQFKRRGEHTKPLKIPMMALMNSFP